MKNMRKPARKSMTSIENCMASWMISNGVRITSTVFGSWPSFGTHTPRSIQIALDYGVRLAKVAPLSEDDPEIEVLALESAEFIKSIPQLKEIICKQTGPKKPLENLYNEMLAVVLPAARIKFNQLFQQYLYL